MNPLEAAREGLIRWWEFLDEHLPQKELSVAERSKELASGFFGGGMAKVIQFPKDKIVRSLIERQLEAQVPRLEKLYESRFPVAEVPQLKGEPDLVTRIFKPEVRARQGEFLGADITRYGGDIYTTGRKIQNPHSPTTPDKFNWHWDYKNFEYPYNAGGVGFNYATEEAARRALIVEAIMKQRKGSWPAPTYKATPPQISEFASPESARQSWRLVDELGNLISP